ncbi:UDP-N-acetylglucosamine 2-epimerase [Parapedobacter sp. 2B3]|uniref:UDP-N-acetylglucosamine 2-epimerase n=1 Tax=Parapedobacter sp. 2B3 TaxID=3342381 RepID=UPI0035B64094
MKIGVLTSSRADFGIYQPLLECIKNDSFFDLELIVFGTHLSKLHGYTLYDIEKNYFTKLRKINTVLANDDENAIATSYALTSLKFADFWRDYKYELVLCLGDRYEMAAAVQAGIPYGIKLAHFHGGETTLGAIDNIYRHQITLTSHIHFTTTPAYADKVCELIGSNDNVFSVGSLSLDGLDQLKLLSEDEFRSQFDILNEYFLVTFHPETVSSNDNRYYAEEMFKGLKLVLTFTNLVITMPNADTQGSLYRDKLVELSREFPKRVKLIENFGKLNYFSAMKYSKGLIGNTSSGIIEAASFGKYVVNVGNRQKGRAQSSNTINCTFSAHHIKDAVTKISSKSYDGANIYFRPDTVDRVIKILKSTP